MICLNLIYLNYLYHFSILEGNAFSGLPFDHIKDKKLGVEALIMITKNDNTCKNI